MLTTKLGPVRMLFVNLTVKDKGLLTEEMAKRPPRVRGAGEWVGNKSADEPSEPPLEVKDVSLAKLISYLISDSYELVTVHCDEKSIPTDKTGQKKQWMVRFCFTLKHFVPLFMVEDLPQGGCRQWTDEEIAAWQLLRDKLLAGLQGLCNKMDWASARVHNNQFYDLCALPGETPTRAALPGQRILEVGAVVPKPISKEAGVSQRHLCVVGETLGVM